MEDAAVLHVGAGTDADGIDVAAQNGIHPDGGALAEDDVAEDLRRDVDIATQGDLRRMALVGSDHKQSCGDLSRKFNCVRGVRGPVETQGRGSRSGLKEWAQGGGSRRGCWQVP